MATGLHESMRVKQRQDCIQCRSSPGGITRSCVCLPSTNTSAPPSSVALNVRMHECEFRFSTREQVGLTGCMPEPEVLPEVRGRSIEYLSPVVPDVVHRRSHMRTRGISDVSRIVRGAPASDRTTRVRMQALQMTSPQDRFAEFFPRRPPPPPCPTPFEGNPGVPDAPQSQCIPGAPQWWQTQPIH